MEVGRNIHTKSQLREVAFSVGSDKMNAPRVMDAWRDGNGRCRYNWQSFRRCYCVTH
jgi:hypothetical protein